MNLHQNYFADENNNLMIFPRNVSLVRSLENSLNYRYPADQDKTSVHRDGFTKLKVLLLSVISQKTCLLWVQTFWLNQHFGHSLVQNKEILLSNVFSSLGNDVPANYAENSKLTFHTIQQRLTIRDKENKPQNVLSAWDLPNYSDTRL